MSATASAAPSPSSKVCSAATKAENSARSREQKSRLRRESMARIASVESREGVFGILGDCVAVWTKASSTKRVLLPAESRRQQSHDGE